MKIKRKREMIVETERSYSIKLDHAAPVQFFCATCSGPSEMLSINEVANLTRLGWREILNRIESGNLHFIETETGEIYVCRISLSMVKQ